MDYCGGTYISQVEAISEREAVQRWAAALDPLPIHKFDVKNKVELIAELQDRHDPVLLNGLVNAWCTGALTSGGSILINVIATAPPSTKI